MELLFLFSYLMVAAVLIVPNFADVPIHYVMVSTAFFAIVAGSHKSMVQTAEAERTGERKVRADAPAPPRAAAACFSTPAARHGLPAGRCAASLRCAAASAAAAAASHRPCSLPARCG